MQELWCVVRQQNYRFKKQKQGQDQAKVNVRRAEKVPEKGQLTSLNQQQSIRSKQRQTKFTSAELPIAMAHL